MKKQTSEIVDELEKELKEDNYISEEFKQKISDFRTGIKQSCREAIEKIKKLKNDR